MSSIPMFTRVANRYELAEELDHGGMGTVYLAYDVTQERRKVALKTISGTPQASQIDLFRNELRVLRDLSHPNIVDVFDSGYFEEQRGVKKPFFVMPLLQGQTLDKQLLLTKRFDKDAAIHIIEQVARGLMVAHERKIIHRDLKPGNIFLLPHNAVKIIDFGVAQLVGSQRSNQYVTFWYTAPEVFRNECSELSDQFSLGAVFYEILTGFRAFEGETREMVMRAILEENPPIASKRLEEIPLLVSQVAHKMMAKDPRRRFASMHEVVDALEKLKRKEPIECFHPENYQKILFSAQAALQRKNFQLASETLDDLDADGYEDEESIALRKDVNAAILEHRVTTDLENARHLSDHGNLEKAKERVESVLAIDKGNIEALALGKVIDERIKATKIARLKTVAREALGKREFESARSSLTQVISFNEIDSEALQMLNEVDRLDQEFKRLKEQQLAAIHSMQEARKDRDWQQALLYIDQIFKIDENLGKQDPRKTEMYGRFASEARAKLKFLGDARSEAENRLRSQEFSSAKKACQAVLDQDPNNAEFQALSVEIDERRQRALFDTITRVRETLENVRRPDERVKILEDAVARFPDLPIFEQTLKTAQNKNSTIVRLVEKARALEHTGRYEEAADLWATVSKAEGAYPELPFELERVRDLADTKRDERKRREWLADVNFYLDVGDCDRADAALQNSPLDDGIHRAIEHRVAERRRGKAEAVQMLQIGQTAREVKDWNRAVESFRRAHVLQPQDHEVLAEYIHALQQLATVERKANPERARQLAREGLDAKPGHTALLDFLGQVEIQRDTDAAVLVRRARESLQASDLHGAMTAVSEGLRIAPGNKDLEQVNSEINGKFHELVHASSLGRTDDLISKAQQFLKQQVNASDLHSVPIIPSGVDKQLEELLGPVDPNVPVQPDGTTLLSQPVPLVSGEQQILPPVPPAATEAKVFEIPRKALLAIAAGFVLVVIFSAVLLNRGASTPDPKPAPKLTRMAIIGAETGQYRIVDEQQKDVTGDLLAGGLPAGSYSVHASRSGFKEVSKPFSVSADGAASSHVTIDWEPLPTQLRIQVTDSRGSLTIDQKPANIDPKSDLIADWSDGPHAVAWKGQGGTSLSMTFEVKNGHPIANSVKLDGVGAVGIGVIVDGGHLSYEAVNSSMVVLKSTRTPPAKVKSIGTYELAPQEVVSFQTPYGNELGTYAAAPDGRSLVTIRIVPWRTITASDAPRPAQPAAVPPSSAGVSQQQAPSEKKQP